MGVVCAREAAFYISDDGDPIAFVPLTKSHRHVIRGIRGVLDVVLPLRRELFLADNDEQSLSELVPILQDVLLQHDATLTYEQQLEMIRLAAPHSVEGDPLRRAVRMAVGGGAGPSDRWRMRQLPQMLYLWFKGDADCSGSLSRSELVDVFSYLNIDHRHVQNMIVDADTSRDGLIDFREFIELYQTLTLVEDVEAIFAQNIEKRKKGMSPQNLAQFCRLTQKEAAFSLPDAWRALGVGNASGLTSRQLQRLLTDRRWNGWMDPVDATNVSHDMTQPMAHYFINSSHNSYLVGHQLHGESSCEMYRRILRSGCRCVEVDIWDGPNNDPAVTHGRTLTSKLRLEDVLLAIAECAFEKSPYPVILSLEVHACAAQKDIAAAMMRRIFGDSFVTASWIDAPPVNWTFSPEGLKYKILAKCKKLGGEKDKAGNQALFDASFFFGTKIFTIKPPSNPYFAIASVDESVPEKWQASLDAWTEYTSLSFVRVYPKALRIDSSNYDATAAIRAGAQMVALNFQTLDEHLRLNSYRFSQNGGCGYVLKPQGLRGGTWASDNVQLTVKVLCGVQLPRPRSHMEGEPSSTFVEVRVHGVDVDPVTSEVISGNGFNPRWRHATLKCTVPSTELATVVIRVFDHRTLAKRLIGEAGCPVSSIRQGFRCVPLVDEEGHEITAPTCLLVHVEADPDPRTVRTTSLREDTLVSYSRLRRVVTGAYFTDHDETAQPCATPM